MKTISEDGEDREDCEDDLEDDFTDFTVFVTFGKFCVLLPALWTPAPLPTGRPPPFPRHPCPSKEQNVVV